MQWDTLSLALHSSISGGNRFLSSAMMSKIGGQAESLPQPPDMTGMEEGSAIVSCRGVPGPQQLGRWGGAADGEGHPQVVSRPEEAGAQRSSPQVASAAAIRMAGGWELGGISFLQD